jgi:hypothetical protein
MIGMRKSRKPSDRAMSYCMEFTVPESGFVDEVLAPAHEFTGKILFDPSDEEDDDVEIPKDGVVGTVKGIRLDIWEARASGVPLFEVCDAHSEELLDCYEDLFEDDDLREDLAIEGHGGLLFIDKIKIEPQHRGFGLGLMTLLKTINQFGVGCAAVAIKPFPLQYCGRNAKSKDKDFAASQKKLVNYWSRLGFARVPDSDFFFFDLAYQLPTMEKLLKALK